MHSNQLSHLNLLYLHPEKIIKIDICKIASKFTTGKYSRKRQFSICKFHNIRVDTVFDSCWVRTQVKLRRNRIQ